MIKTKLSTVFVIMFLLIAGIAGVYGSCMASDSINLRLQSHTPPTQTSRNLDRFIQMVSDLSGGKIKITSFPVGALVPMNTLLESISANVVDMATAPEGYFYKVVPVSEIGQGLPFAFENHVESTYFMFHKGFLELLRKGYEKQNVYVIPFEPYNTGLMTKKPITGVADLKGMKLRAYGTMQKWLTNLGASTVYISGGELYTSLATGVVEGAHWGDAFPMYEMKFQEVLKNYMKPEPIIGSWNSIWVNMDVWNKKLNAEQRNIIETAALAAGFAYQTTETRTRTQFALKDMKEKWNVKVNQVPEAEIEKMRIAGKKVWDEIAANKDPLCKQAIDLLYEFLDELGRGVK